MELYRHQIGGHCQLVKPLDSSQVFKPFNENEYYFYEKITTDESCYGLNILTRFIPKYYGIKEILIPNDKRIKNNLSETLIQNGRYLVLEDLVYLYRKPCVLDLKMGLRQRKLGATKEKKQRQVAKSLNSTSHAIGFRLCGYQSHDIINNIQCNRDKYWGRQLTKDSLSEYISKWFWNGEVYYIELLEPLIDRLKELQNCMIILFIYSLGITQLHRYRFWSSSLLLVYDGYAVDYDSRLQSLNVKMIDFQNIVICQEAKEPDKEYMFGLKNLIDFLVKLMNSLSLDPMYFSSESKLSFYSKKAPQFYKVNSSTGMCDKEWNIIENEQEYITLSKFYRKKTKLEKNVF